MQFIGSSEAYGDHVRSNRYVWVTAMEKERSNKTNVRCYAFCHKTHRPARGGLLSLMEIHWQIYRSFGCANQVQVPCQIFRSIGRCSNKTQKYFAAVARHYGIRSRTAS